MSQHDFDVANQGFPSFRADMNAAFQALASQSSGATAPTTMYAYQLWYDTTTDTLKMRNADNDAWISIALFDQVADTWSIVGLDAGSAAAPTITPTGDTNTGFFFPAADTVGVSTAGSEAMRVDSSGNVGIGTSSPLTELSVAGDYGTTTFPTLGSPDLYSLNVGNEAKTYGLGVHINNSGTTVLQSQSFTAATAYDLSLQPLGGNLLVGTTTSVANALLNVSGGISTNTGIIGHRTSDTFTLNGKTQPHYGFNFDYAGSALAGMSGYYGLAFATHGSERARISQAGDLLVGKTSANTTVAGFEARSTGIFAATVSGNLCGYINRLTNDGALLEFRQNNTVEGTISVSGTTVSYNGGHLARWSRLPDGTDDSNILKGTVMTNLDQMIEWIGEDGNPEDNEQLNFTNTSSVEGDPNVAGVFVAWDDSDEWGDYYLAMTGDMVIRIAQGVTVQQGDLLMSAGDGTAKPQEDDLVRSKTIAKVISTHKSHEYADGSYCVPCVLMAC